MTRADWLTYWRCGRKRRYGSRERAEVAVRRVVHRRKREGIRVYECDLCAGWHFGHRWPRDVTA